MTHSNDYFENMNLPTNIINKLADSAHMQSPLCLSKDEANYLTRLLQRQLRSVMKLAEKSPQPSQTKPTTPIKEVFVVCAETDIKGVEFAVMAAFSDEYDATAYVDGLTALGGNDLEYYMDSMPIDTQLDK